MPKLNFLKNVNRNVLSITVAVIAIAIIGVLIFFAGTQGNIFGMSNDQIGKKAVDYINNNGLSSSSASVVSVATESGLVKIKIKIDTNEFDSYATKDGKLLFPQAFEMDKKSDEKSDANASTAPTAEQIQASCDATKKTDNPALEAFVVSKCPFGLQMQRILADVIKNAPDLSKNIMVRYIGAVSGNTITSMHGDAEAQENLRQICIRDEQRSKYWNYVSCHIKAGDVDGCLASASIDKTKLSSCMSTASRGVAYAKKDFDLATKYNVGGSPTMILGGAATSEFDFGGRTSEAVKTLVCCAYNNKPGVCSTTLNKAEAATSFSDTYEGTGGTGNSGANGANCAPAQ